MSFWNKMKKWSWISYINPVSAIAVAIQKQRDMSKRNAGHTAEKATERADEQRRRDEEIERHEQEG